MISNQQQHAVTSSSFVVRRSSFVVRRSSFVVRRSSFVVRCRSSFVEIGGGGAAAFLLFFLPSFLLSFMRSLVCSTVLSFVRSFVRSFPVVDLHQFMHCTGHIRQQCEPLGRGGVVGRKKTPTLTLCVVYVCLWIGATHDVVSSLCRRVLHPCSSLRHTSMLATVRCTAPRVVRQTWKQE